MADKKFVYPGIIGRPRSRAEVREYLQAFIGVRNHAAAAAAGVNEGVGNPAPAAVAAVNEIVENPVAAAEAVDEIVGNSAAVAAGVTGDVGKHAAAAAEIVGEIVENLAAAVEAVDENVGNPAAAAVNVVGLSAPDIGEIALLEGGAPSEVGLDQGVAAAAVDRLTVVVRDTGEASGGVDRVEEVAGKFLPEFPRFDTWKELFRKKLDASDVSASGKLFLDAENMKELLSVLSDADQQILNSEGKLLLDAMDEDGETWDLIYFRVGIGGYVAKQWVAFVRERKLKRGDVIQMKWSPDPFYYKRPLLVINPPALLAPAIDIKSSDVHGGRLTTYNYDTSAGLRINFDIFFPGDPAPNFPVMYWVHGDVSQDLLTGAFTVARGEGVALICISGKSSSVENWYMSLFVVNELPDLIREQFPQLDTTRAAISGFTGCGNLSMFLSKLEGGVKEGGVQLEDGLDDVQQGALFTGSHTLELFRKILTSHDVSERQVRLYLNAARVRAIRAVMNDEDKDVIDSKNKLSLCIIDENGEEWDLTLTKKGAKADGGYLAKKWLVFVKARKLKEGDIIQLKWSRYPLYYKKPLLVINPSGRLPCATVTRSSDLPEGCLTAYQYSSSSLGQRLNFEVFVPRELAQKLPVMYWVHGDVAQDLLTGAFVVARREGVALICIPGGKFSSVELGYERYCLQRTPCVTWPAVSSPGHDTGSHIGLHWTRDSIYVREPGRIFCKRMTVML